jgi:hypothetical protein
MISGAIINRLKKTIICLVADELMDHFGGGLSEERVIRESEAIFIATRIWEKLSKTIVEWSCETPGGC